MLALWMALSLAWAEPVVLTVRSPLPTLDMSALVHVQARPGVWHTCRVTAVIDHHGTVRTALVAECPDALQSPSLRALERWDFYPPTQGGQAVAVDLVVPFRYISGVVVTDPPPGDERPRVRVPPAAVPRWPSEPTLKRRARREAEGESGVMCKMSLEFDGRGQPDAVELIDCPDAVADVALRRLGRFGVQLVEGEPGDGQRYLMEVWLATSRRDR